MKHKIFPKYAARLLILLLVTSMMALIGFASVPAAGASEQAFTPASYASEGKIETSDLETFTDELLTRQLTEYHIAGVIVSIVQDGKIELAKGYGYADVEAQTPVNPDETIFRIGSTSKVFIWTAVMQLAEQGKIDLNADVNQYLPDFQIPDTYPEPITMLNLLSHTAGFEERTTGTEAKCPEEMISLHDYLATYMPDRVRPAGALITYSNYGAALAGYIVEAVSGMSFEQYVEMYIFGPLNMTHSTFRQPLPEDLKDHLANSYSYNGGFVPGKFDYVILAPAATMATTAHDMANFMIAHLQDGKFENNQILNPETVRQMQSHLFSNDERLDGFAYGIMEWNYNGQRILWHSGDFGNWHSGLAIIPEQNLGFFVNYNSNEGYAAVIEFYYAFMDAFFPAQAARDPIPAQGDIKDVGYLAGEYRSTRSVYNHVERIMHFLGNGNVHVTVNPDGTLSFGGLTLYPKEPLVFMTQDGTDTFIFHQDDSGNITYLLENNNQLWSYEPVYWYETSAFNLLVLSICCALLLTVPLVAIFGIFRRRKGVKDEHRLPRIARIWTFILSAIFLLVLVIINIYTSVDYKSPFPLYMVATLGIILAASILVIGPVIFTVIAWGRRYWNLAGRIHYTLVTTALLGMVWLMYYWRLLGFRF